MRAALLSVVDWEWFLELKPLSHLSKSLNQTFFGKMGFVSSITLIMREISQMSDITMLVLS